MGRTKGSRNINKFKTGKQQFENLDPTRKVIVYNYYINLKNAPEKQIGWNVSKVGSVDHWKSSAFIQQNIPKQSFYHLAKVRVCIVVNILRFVQQYLAHHHN